MFRTSCPTVWGMSKVEITQSELMELIEEMDEEFVIFVDLEVEDDG